MSGEQMSNNFPDIKRVCIYGTGGVGGYFGGKIAEVFNNNPQFKDYEIYFIARGEHLRAIKQRGIMVKTPERTISARPTLATDNIRDIPSPDLILLCVKSYDLNQTVAAIKPVLHDNTVIIPLLNGVDIIERIRAILDEGILLPACLYLGTHIESPGVINQSGGNGIIILGPDRKNPEYTGKSVKDFFQKTGIKYKWYDDPLPWIWEKYIFMASFGMVTAVTGESLGTIMKNDKHQKMVRGIMEEIYAIARVKTIKLPEDIIEKSMQKASNFSDDARTSYQRDIESGSRSNEGDLFGGTIIREGKALGVSTPITESAYQKITKLYGK
jgi:2-dehydropantoate 2-reductase